MKEALKLAIEALKKTQAEGYNLPSMAISEAILVAEAALAQPDNTAKLYEELRSIIDGGSESFTHNDAVQYLKDVLAQPDQNLNCKSVQARLATAWGYVKAEQEPVKIAHKHQWFRTGEMKVGQMRCISCGTWGQEDRPQQPKNQKQRPFTKKQRDTLCTVYAIASASTTANSLPNIAKIVNELLTEDLEVQPKEPEQEPVAWIEQEWSGSGLRHLHFERHEPTVRDEVMNPVWTPLYTTPPQRTAAVGEDSKAWIDLTDEEMQELYLQNHEAWQSFACAIEAKSKEKNT